MAEAHRLLQGHSQPRESAGNGGNWEEKLGQTPLEPRVKPLMEPPPLVAGEFLLPVFPTLESSLEHSMNLVVNPLSLELDWESRQGSDSQNRFQADFVPFFFFLLPHLTLGKTSRNGISETKRSSQIIPVQEF